MLKLFSASERICDVEVIEIESPELKFDDVIELKKQINNIVRISIDIKFCNKILCRLIAIIFNFCSNRDIFTYGWKSW